MGDNPSAPNDQILEAHRSSSGRTALSLRHIRYFLAAAEELNFTAAAKRLNITQPPLSRQIKELEDQIGAALFVHEGRRTRLTPVGEVFKEEAYRVLDQVQSALHSARAAAAGEAGVIHLAYMPVAFCYQPFLDALKLFRKRHPDVRVTLTQMSPAAQLEALKYRQVDFGVVHIETVIGDEFELNRVFDEPVELLLPVDHRLSKQASIGLHDVVDEPFIMTSRRWCPPFYDRFMQVWRAYNTEPRIVQETESFAVSLALVANGMGITFGSPALCANFTAPVKSYRIAELQMRMGADLVWCASHVSPSMERFIAALNDVKQQRNSNKQ